MVKARALSGSTWSALNEAVFAVGPVAESLRVSEIMYHPADTGNPNDPNTEYIELTNIANQSINLNLVRFTDGIDYTFPSFELPAGGYCLVVKDLTAFRSQVRPQAARGGGVCRQSGQRRRAHRIGGCDRPDHPELRRIDDSWFKNTDGLGYLPDGQESQNNGRE